MICASWWQSPLKHSPEKNVFSGQFNTHGIVKTQALSWKDHGRACFVCDRDRPNAFPSPGSLNVDFTVLATLAGGRGMPPPLHAITMLHPAPHPAPSGPLSRGMTATGSHEYFYSLRGAQPPGEGIPLKNRPPTVQRQALFRPLGNFLP